MRLEKVNNELHIYDGITKVYIKPWGENSLRVMMTKEPEMDSNDWALTEKVAEISTLY